MSLKVSDRTLIENLLERHSLEETFEILAKGVAKKDTRELLVYLLKKLDYDTDEIVDLMLDTEKVQEEVDKYYVSSLLEKVFDSIRLKYRDQCKSVYDVYEFQNRYLPDVGDLVDTINDQYLVSDAVLESYDPDKLINFLEDTTEFTVYIDNVKSEAVDQYEEDVEEDAEYWREQRVRREAQEEIKKGTLFEGLSPDDKWKFFCNSARCSYYDKKRLTEYLNEVKEELEKSSYSQEIEKPKR